MTSVMKAFDVYKRRKTSGDLGVEIEVEGHNLPGTQKFWNEEYDGSLRGECKEYVLRKPSSYEGVVEALDYLDKRYKMLDTKVYESVRAGVHVHVNVQDLSTVQLFTFITAYIVLEDLLVNFCGEYREGNLFCLRLKDADYLQYVLEKTAKDRDFQRFNNDILRYSSMNVVSLHKFGSLEFRAMRGTRDLGAIKNWAKVLLNLRDSACKFENPIKLIDWMSDSSTENFLELFLGDLKKELCQGKDLDKYVREGLCRATSLAKCVDWDSYSTKMIGGLEFSVDEEFPDEPQEDF